MIKKLLCPKLTGGYTVINGCWIFRVGYWIFKLFIFSISTHLKIKETYENNMRDKILLGFKLCKIQLAELKVVKL